MRIRIAVVVSTMVVFLWAGVLAEAGTPKTRLVSQTSSGQPANDFSADPDVSGSGRFVAFESDATNLPGDDAWLDVYVHDRETGKTRLISKTSAGVPATGGHSTNVSISGSGRFVAFQSSATNLPGEAPTNAYVHDRQTGVTQLVSKTSSGEPAADGDSTGPVVSDSGRYVAFESDATNLPGDDAWLDVYLRDRETGKTRLISQTSGEAPANGSSFDPAVSDSGRFVAFDSDATNLPGDDTVSDVYVRDVQAGKTRLVSKDSGGDPGNGSSRDPSISGTGRYVAFRSSAENLAGGSPLVADIFVHDRQTGTTRLISKSSAGDPADDNCDRPDISDSGRYVAFESHADNLPGDDAVEDVYVHDRQTGNTRLVSKTSGGNPANGSSENSSLSNSGSWVAFESLATNLPGDDTVQDAFIHGPLI